MRVYTEEIIEFILANYLGKSNVELAKILNEKFNINATGDSVGMFKANYKRRKGIDLRTGINPGCFKKGNIPINKGTKGVFNVGGNKTSFQKGNVPPNRVPIGTERLTKEGYIEVKIQDGHLNKNWKLKHRLIYEQHYGDIPTGYNVIFLDGNRQNFDISNLKLISRAEDLIMNKNKLFSKDKEITESGALIAKVINKSNMLKRK